MKLICKINSSNNQQIIYTGESKNVNEDPIKIEFNFSNQIDERRCLYQMLYFDDDDLENNDDYASSQNDLKFDCKISPSVTLLDKPVKEN